MIQSKPVQLLALTIYSGTVTTTTLTHRGVDKVWDNMSLSLKEITPDNWRIINSLKVREEQKRFVASNMAILAKAFAYRKDNSRVYGIYIIEDPIGIIIYAF